MGLVLDGTTQCDSNERSRLCLLLRYSPLLPLLPLPALEHMKSAKSAPSETEQIRMVSQIKCMPKPTHLPVTMKTTPGNDQETKFIQL